MRNKLKTLIPLFVLIIPSCGGGQSSTSTSEEEKKNKVTFENAYRELVSLEENEYSHVSKQNYKETVIGGAIKEVKTTTTQVYEDKSSSSVGTYEQTINDEVTLNDTFKAVKTTTEDVYDFGGVQETYPMYVEIRDYQNDASFKSMYSDSMSKKFILRNEQEAEKAGLSRNQYILEDEYQYYTVDSLAKRVEDFIDSTLASNYYITQLGLDSLVVDVDSNNNHVYSFDAEYSYSADGHIVTEQVSLMYTLNSEKNNIVSFKHSYSSTESDNESSYTSTVVFEANNEFEERPTQKGSDVLKVDTYTLASISKIGLKARDSKFNDIVVDAAGVPASCSYIFPYAEKYSPSKALDISISSVSSSDETVVELNNSGVFEIIGVGKTTLKFSYYKKISGVYYLTTVSVEVTITEAQAERVSFVPKTNMYLNYGLNTSSTYTWEAAVSPSKVAQVVTATSSDPSVLEVTANGDNTITLTPKKEGKATITISSYVTPEVTATKEFYVLDPELDATSFLTSHTFKHYSPYGYTTTMTFNPDGTGTTRQVVNDGSSGPYVAVFKWSLDKTQVNFSSWDGQYFDNNFECATIVKWLDKENEPMGVYAETDAKGQGFIIE